MEQSKIIDTLETYQRPQLLCVLLVHITSTHKPGFDATVGELSNFKNFLRTRKIMVMHSNERGECRPLIRLQRIYNF